MEVEVKLRLPSAEAHEDVAKLFMSSYETTHNQENVFFDGVNKELSTQRIVLRVRFYNNDAKCVLTVKGKAVLVEGIGRATEEEVDIEPATGRAFVSDPTLLATSDIPLVAELRKKLGCSGFVCLGGFKNVRKVFSWNGHKLELDETQFPFGTQYEIECESNSPEQLKQELQALLIENGISFRDSKFTKFAAFRAGKLLE